MSAHGEDIRFDEVLRKVFPVSIEAKYKDKGLSNVYSAYEQAQRQTESIASTIDIKAVAVIKQKNSIPLIVMSADDWIQSFKPNIQNAANTNDEDI